MDSNVDDEEEESTFACTPIGRCSCSPSPVQCPNVSTQCTEQHEQRYSPCSPSTCPDSALEDPYNSADGSHPRSRSSGQAGRGRASPPWCGSKTRAGFARARRGVLSRHVSQLVVRLRRSIRAHLCILPHGLRLWACHRIKDRSRGRQYRRH